MNKRSPVREPLIETERGTRNEHPTTERVLGPKTGPKDPASHSVHHRSEVDMKDGMDILKIRNFNAAEESIKYRGLNKELLPTQFEESPELPDDPSDEWIIERVGRVKGMSTMGRKVIKSSLSEIQFNIVGGE